MSRPTGRGQPPTGRAGGTPHPDRGGGTPHSDRDGGTPHPDRGGGTPHSDRDGSLLPGRGGGNPAPVPADDEFSFVFLRPPDRRVTMHTRLLEAGHDRIVVTHEIAPSKPLIFRGETVADSGYRAVWFLFKGRSYDVGRFYRPDGTWTGYYADVLEPVRWTGADPRTLEPLVDLFLDLWIAPDGEYAVLDEDEFAAAVAAGRLTDRQIGHARQAIGEMTAAVERGLFPPQVVRTYHSRTRGG